MLCCGSSTKPPANAETLLAEIRKTDELKLKLTLDEYMMDFISKDGSWKTNFKQKPSPLLREKKEIIQKIQGQLEIKDKQIDELERQYLARIAKLLVMAQVHCEIKTDINLMFDKLGVSHTTIEKKRVEEINSEHDGLNA